MFFGSLLNINLINTFNMSNTAQTDLGSDRCLSQNASQPTIQQTDNLNLPKESFSQNKKKSEQMMKALYSSKRAWSDARRRNHLTDVFVELIRENDITALQCFYARFYQEIDAHRNHEEPFRTACIVGNIDVVCFMFGFISDIDLSAYNHEAFRMCCIANHIPVAQWFNKIDDRYTVVMKSETKIDHDASLFLS